MRCMIAGCWLLLAALLSGAGGSVAGHGQLDWVLEGLDKFANKLLALNASEDVDVDGLVRSRVDDYISLVKRSFGLDAVAQLSNRLKRGVVPKDPHEVFMLKLVKERFNVPVRFPDDIVLFSRLEAGVVSWFAAALETDLPHPEQQRANHVVLYKLMEGRFLEQWRGPVEGGVALAVQEMTGWTYVVVAERQAAHRDPPRQGSRLFRLTLDGHSLVEVQTLSTPSPSDLCFWEFQGSYYLGVATGFSNETGTATHSAESLVYQWFGEHLDIVYRLPSSGARAISAFSIEGQHFIAVANHINDEGQTSIASTVFRLSVEHGRYMVHQNLRTHGAMDVEFFSMQQSHGTDYFLAVANSLYQGVDGRDYETSSVVYKWSEGFFIPFQSFQLPAVRQWSSYSGPRGELVLFAASMYGVHAFQYDGWRFQEVPLKANGNFAVTGAGIVRLRTLNFGIEALLVVASKHNPGTAASVLSLMLERRAPVDERRVIDQLWCQEKLASVLSGRAVQQLERVRASPKFDTLEVVVHAPLTFTGNSSLLRIDTATIKTPNFVQDESYRNEVINLSKRHLEQERQLTELRSILDRSLKKNSVNVVAGTVVLDRAGVQCKGPCVFPKAVVGTLNGESAELLVRKTIRLDENIHLPGELRFSKVMMAELNVGRVLGQEYPLVSRVDTPELMSSLAVRGLETTAALQVDGFVDGVRVHRDHVLLVSGDQTFLNSAQAKTWQVDNMTFRGRLNGIHFNFRVPVLPPEMMTPWTFPETLAVNSISLTGLLGPVSVADVAARALRTTGPQVLTGTHTFSSLAARGVRASTINNIDVEKELVRTDLIQEIIPGHLSFSQPLIADRVQVYRRLGPVQVGVDGTLDLLLSKSPVRQEVTGVKRLRKMEVTGQARVHGRIVGFELPPADVPVLRVVQENIEIFGNVEISGAVRLAGDLKAEDVLDESGRSLLEALSSSVRLDSGVLPAAVIEDLEVSSLRTDLVNNVPTKSWIRSSQGETVHLQAPTTFVGDVFVLDGSELTGQVNNVDLVALDRQALKQTGDQIITGFKSFNRVTVDGAWSNNTIVNSVRWLDLWAEYSRDVAEISGNVLLKAPLVTNHLTVVGRVNNIDPEAMLEDSVFSDGGHSVIEGSKTFSQVVNVRHMDIQETVSGSGGLVLRLINGGSEVPEEVTYTGNVVVKEPLSVKHLNFEGSLNGVLDSDWSAPWLESDGDQTLYGIQTFLRVVDARSGVNVTHLNSVDVRRWAQNLVRLDDPSLRFGKVTFEAPVFATGPVLAGAVVGVNLSDALLSQPSTCCGSPQVVTAPVVLAGGLQVDRSLFVDLLAGENFRDLCAFTNPAPGAWTDAQHLKVEGNLLLDEEMVVKNVNGQSMKKLLKNTWLRDKTTYISGEMTFKDLNLTGEVKVKDRIDGVSLNELANRYVSLSSDQAILTSIRFNDGIVLERDLFSNGPVEVHGKVGGVVLKDFEDAVLRDGPDQDVYATMKFGIVSTTGNLSLSGTVNGLNLLEDVVRLDREVNEVREKKTVTGSVWIGDLDMDGGARVQGVDLAAWNREAVRITGDQRVSGAKTLTAPRLASDMKVTGLVNGISVDDKHLLLRHGDQEVRAAKTLVPQSGFVGIQALELDGQVNTVDMRALLANQAYRTGDVEVVSPVRWHAPLHGKSTLVERMYHGVNVSQLIFAAQHPSLVEAYQPQHEALMRTAERVQHSLRAQGYYLNYFHWSASLRNVLAVLPLSLTEDDPAAAIAVVNRTAPGAPLLVQFFRWDAESGRLVSHPDVEPVSLPPSVTLISAARFGGQSAMYFEADETGTPNVGLHLGYVIGLMPDGRLGLAPLVRETQPSAWVHVAELGSRACVIRGTSGEKPDCTLRCTTASSMEAEVVLSIPATHPVHAVTLTLRDVPQLLIANAANEHSEGGVDVWSWDEARNVPQLVQTIGVVNATALATIKFRGVHYLAVASGRADDTPHAGLVHISRFNDAHGNWTHWLTLPVESPMRLQFAVLPSAELALYVSVDCPDESLIVFLYRGITGFVRKAALAVPAIARGPLSAFTTAQHQHLITSTDGGHAVLLHAVFKGSWEASEKAYFSKK